MKKLFTIVTLLLCVVVGASGTTISAQPQAATINDYSSASFSVTATGTGVLSYQWRFRGANVGSNSSSYSFTPAYTDSGYKICVLITDNNGTTVSDSALLTVHAIAPLVIGEPANKKQAINKTATFTVQAIGTEPKTYQWQKLAP